MHLFTLLCLLPIAAATTYEGNELEYGINSARYILSQEEIKAKATTNKRFTASSRAMAFLSSSVKIKKLGNCALAQEIALRECMRRYNMRHNRGDLSCDAFWRGVSTGQICAQTSLSRTKHATLDSCPSRYCPYEVPTCDPSHRYRTADGTCNNEKYPWIGSAGRATQRFLPPDYADCIRAPRDVPYGLPSARTLSNKLFQSDHLPESTILTVMHMQYGQLIDHDTDRVPISKLFDSQTDRLVDIDCGGSQCMTGDAEYRNCLPIQVDHNDKVFRNSCLHFVRSEHAPTDDCKPTPRQQLNSITSWLDSSNCYESHPDAARNLRDGRNGKMKTIPHPFNSRFKPLCPTQDDESCRNTTDVIKCFQAGDNRQNEQAGLTALHMVFMRYHNYIAENLQRRHPSWDDEKLYQEAKRILNAVYQMTIYNEFLPPLLGADFMKAFRLYPGRGRQYFVGYTDDVTRVNPDTANVFATAAFRFGHSLIPDKMKFSDPSLRYQEEVDLSEVFFNPNKLYKSGILRDSVSGVNAVIIGQTDQKAMAMDHLITKQVAGHLFTDHPPHGEGTDLPALNTQRGRDHGLPSYGKWRRWANGAMERHHLYKYRMRSPTTFDDMTDFIPKHKSDLLDDIYMNVNDVDLWPAALLEDPVEGGILGPTFATVIAQQFHNYKFGDRYYFERQDDVMQFTREQLVNIREQTIASMFCKTLEDEPHNPNMRLNFQRFVLLQPYNDAYKALRKANMNPRQIDAMLKLYKGESNDRVPCSQLPELNFDLF